jgi:transposase-like protein
MTALPKNIDHPCYHDDDAARIVLETIFWPYGPTCPTCGKIDTVSVLGGKSMGPGWYWCSECRDKFTVRVGSVLERSHIPLHKWMLGFRLYASSKKGFSAHQLMRTIGLGSYRSAWFMAHRIREAMDGSTDHDDGPLGGEGKVVEADETRFGTKKREEWTLVNGVGWVRSARREQMLVMTLVERGGRARSFKVEDLTSDTLRGVLVTNASRKSDLNTDEFSAYREPGREFNRHERVNHAAKEYGRRTRDGRKVTTNTVEGYFSIFKRGMIGVYQHCSEKHLARYLSEFDFRYSNRSALGVEDTERAERAIKGAVGRRLTYRQPDRRASA